jgi:hypothetical protein
MRKSHDCPKTAAKWALNDHEREKEQIESWRALAIEHILHCKEACEMCLLIRTHLVDKGFDASEGNGL